MFFMNFLISMNSMKNYPIFLRMASYCILASEAIGFYRCMKFALFMWVLGKGFFSGFSEIIKASFWNILDRVPWLRKRWIESVLFFILVLLFGFQSKMIRLIELFFEFVKADLGFGFFWKIIMRISFAQINSQLYIFSQGIISRLTFSSIFRWY